MARDPKACDKAVREAWKRERELVLAGKGTRDWDEEQQLEIIELGKVYDDDGFAFAGQHMKSVAAHPEHQGNPNNIQLLSNSEHLMLIRVSGKIQQIGIITRTYRRTRRIQLSIEISVTPIRQRLNLLN